MELLLDGAEGCAAIKISSAIKMIKESHFLLPALQRSAVWGTDRITALFDSLFRGFPIGMVLLLKINGREDLGLTTFYSFNKREAAANIFDTDEYKLDVDDEKYCVMDGQQRLTALYRGIYVPSKKNNKPTNLCFNLLYRSRPEGEEPKLFAYKKKSERENCEGGLWISLQELYESASLEGVVDKEVARATAIAEEYSGTKWESIYKARHAELLGLRDEAIAAAGELYSLLRERECVGCQIISLSGDERDTKIDKILTIFERLNKGGKPLSSADLLYSQIATFYGRSAGAADIRQKLDGYVTELNSASGEPSFTTDQLMRAIWLTFAGKGVSFNSFFATKAVKDYCKDEFFDAVHTALIKARDSYIDNGFILTKKTPYSIFIPIAYYFYYAGKAASGEASRTVQKEISKYYEVVIASRYLSTAHPDTLMQKLRAAMSCGKETGISLFEGGVFDFARLKSAVDSLTDHADRFRLEVTEEHIENILSLSYETDRDEVTRILYLLNRDWLWERPKDDDVDHIHPRKLAADKYPDSFNLLPNLQLLEARVNRVEKQGMALDEWLGKYHSDKLEDYARKMLVTADTDGITLDYFSFDKYERFFEERKCTFRAELKKIFNI